MHSIKRDKIDKAYKQGYRAGIRGHSQDLCNHFEEDARAAWFNGWREGKDQNFSGDKFLIKIYHGKLKLD